MFDGCSTALDAMVRVPWGPVGGVLCGPISWRKRESPPESRAPAPPSGPEGPFGPERALRARRGPSGPKGPRVCGEAASTVLCSPKGPKALSSLGRLRTAVGGRPKGRVQGRLGERLRERPIEARPGSGRVRAEEPQNHSDALCSFGTQF